MANDAAAELQNAKTGPVVSGPEQTRPGVVYTPACDIFESEHAITVLADMPGVRPADLTIDLRDNVLTLSGRTASPEAPQETEVLREVRPGVYYRQFTLAETIDQAKIDAKLANGVLRLELPKAERVRPRQITVRTA
jgi:HSP20 family molecular chaperone IbpA